jgi:hypothetical protein
MRANSSSIVSKLRSRAGVPRGLPSRTRILTGSRRRQKHVTWMRNV